MFSYLCSYNPTVLGCVTEIQSHHLVSHFNRTLVRYQWYRTLIWPFQGTPVYNIV